MENPKKINIVVGITGGIAGFKSSGLIARLKKKGYAVSVLLTRSAVNMFGRKMFEKCGADKVFTDLVVDNFDYKKVLLNRKVDHIDLARNASLIIIAPATANIIAKLAHGFADDYLSVLCLSSNCPKIICPSMNDKMWNNSLVKKNMEILNSEGYITIGPVEGSLACGVRGVGRMSEVEDILESALILLKNKNKLKGKKIMVTAGGTSEAIDPVRVITNRASGKMGYAIAKTLKLWGAEVMLVRSKTAVHSGGELREEVFETGESLRKIIQGNIGKFDAIFHTAAVSDFVPKSKFSKKLDSSKSLTLYLEKTTKILHSIRDWNPGVFLVGFKAVYRKSKQDALEAGIQKLAESRSDFIVVNDVGRDDVGFASDFNEVYLVGKDGFKKHFSKETKTGIAMKIVSTVFNI
jgi:phosphopantothenoylcysteine decarboxylase/phosphopantothenate--cysteine ligase